MAVIETKAKEILIAVWKASDTSFPTSGKALNYVIADTFSAVQDDPEAQTFEFETSDTGETTYTAGPYQVDLNNAELSKDFMTEIMGWEEITIGSGSDAVPGIVAPETYETRYIALQIKMAENKYYFLPKISIAPKLTMESIKTNLVYGSINGTATNTEVTGTVNGETVTKRTSFGKFEKPILTIAAD